MTKPTKRAARIILDEENAPKRIYANGAVINHSDFDFTISFFEFLPPLNPPGSEEEGITLIVPIVARIGINAELLPKLIKALQTNYDAYLSERENS